MEKAPSDDGAFFIADNLTDDVCKIYFVSCSFQAHVSQRLSKELEKLEFVGDHCRSTGLQSRLEIP